MQKEIVRLLQQRLDAGEISRPELTAAQIALNKTQLDLSEARSLQAEARSRLAEALGLGQAALDGENLNFDFSPTNATALTSADARRWRCVRGRTFSPRSPITQRRKTTCV